MKELNKVVGEVDRMRRDIADKCTVGELLETKSKIYTVLDTKVDLKEV
jgi:hypothetical protein